jgi:hypothetical protein
MTPELILKLAYVGVAMGFAWATPEKGDSGWTIFGGWLLSLVWPIALGVILGHWARTIRDANQRGQP